VQSGSRESNGIESIGSISGGVEAVSCVVRAGTWESAAFSSAVLVGKPWWSTTGEAVQAARNSSTKISQGNFHLVKIANLIKAASYQGQSWLHRTQGSEIISITIPHKGKMRI
jgi:hypothetical protein